MENQEVVEKSVAPVAIPALVEAGVPFPHIPRIFMEELLAPKHKYFVSPGDYALYAMNDGYELEGEFITSLIKGPPKDDSLHLISLDIDYPVELRGDDSLSIQSPRLSGTELDAFLEVLLSFKLIDPPFGMPHFGADMHEMPRLDFRVAVQIAPSSSGKHFHVYVDKTLSWTDYLKLLEACRDACLIGQDFFAMSKRNRMSILLRPGFTKQQLEERRVQKQRKAQERSEQLLRRIGRLYEFPGGLSVRTKPLKLGVRRRLKRKV